MVKISENHFRLRSTAAERLAAGDAGGRLPPPRPQDPELRRGSEDGRRNAAGGRTRGHLVIITIDGPSGTGKSTAARLLAKKLGFLYLDTGAMYRAIALRAREEAIPWDDGPALARLAGRSRITFRKAAAGRVRVFVNGRDVTRAVRRPEISSGASQVATFTGVRRALVRQQRAIGRTGGLVAEGRDTGTVVFPRAPLKFFLTAGSSERARRRWRELRAAGHRVSFPEVLREVRRRDRRDRQRSASPLRPARGAVRIDNAKLQSTQVLAILVDYVRGV